MHTHAHAFLFSLHVTCPHESPCTWHFEAPSSLVFMFPTMAGAGQADIHPRFSSSDGRRCWWAVAPPKVLVASVCPYCSHHLHELRAGTVSLSCSQRPLRASICLSHLTLGTAKPLVFLLLMMQCKDEAIFPMW